MDLEDRFDKLQAFLTERKRKLEIDLDVAGHNGSYGGQREARQQIDFINDIERIMGGR